MKIFLKNFPWVVFPVCVFFLWFKSRESIICFCTGKKPKNSKWNKPPFLSSFRKLRVLWKLKICPIRWWWWLSTNQPTNRPTNSKEKFSIQKTTFTLKKMSYGWSFFFKKIFEYQTNRIVWRSSLAKNKISFGFIIKSSFWS